METTRRGFLKGLFGTAVIAVLPNPVFQEAHAEQVPNLIAPEGMTYQWVRAALLGDQSWSRIDECLENGWQLVPPSQHPQAVSVDIEEAVKGDGLVLMMKPTEIVERERADKYKRDMALLGQSHTYPTGEGTRYDPPVPGAKLIKRSTDDEAP